MRQEEVLSEIATEATDPVVRSVLIRIRTEVSVLDNVKVLNTQFKKRELQQVLSFLRGYEGSIVHSEVEMFLLEGLGHEILRTVSNLLAHKCDQCEEEVVSSLKATPHTKCTGCGIGACTNCYLGGSQQRHYLCAHCAEELVESWSFPDHMLKSSVRKQTAKDLGATPEILEDQSQSQAQSGTPASLPCAQGSWDSPVTQEPSQSSSLDQSLQLSLGLEEWPVVEWGSLGGPRLVTQVTVHGGPEEQERPAVERGSLGGPRLVAEASPAGGDGDGEGFQVPIKRARSDAAKAAKAAKVAVATPATQEKVCPHYSRGTCKFGLKGTNPKDGVTKCPLSHPTPCQKLLDHGTAKTSKQGCSKGKSCTLYHPRMCQGSIASRSCSKVFVRGRCPDGYHVRGTKKPKDTIAAGSGDPTAGGSQLPAGGQPGPTVWSPTPASAPVHSDQAQEAALQAFFCELIRKEMFKLLTGSQSPLSVSPGGGLGLFQAQPTPSASPTTTLADLLRARVPLC